VIFAGTKGAAQLLILAIKESSVFLLYLIRREEG